MAAIAFDTLKYSKRLKDAGVPEKQAEVEAEALAEVLEIRLRDLATKDDIQTLRDEIKALDERLSGKINALDEKLSGKISALDEKLSGKINTLEERLGDKMTLLEQRMTIKLGGLMVVSVGAVATLVKLL